MPTDADVLGDEPIWHDGKVVGWVTSGGFAHFVDKSMAQGYVPKEFAGETGKGAFEIEIIGERRKATIITEPLFDPEGREDADVGEKPLSRSKARERGKSLAAPLLMHRAAAAWRMVPPVGLHHAALAIAVLRPHPIAQRAIGPVLVAPLRRQIEIVIGAA